MVRRWDQVRADEEVAMNPWIQTFTGKDNDNEIEDLKKARWYLDRLISNLEGSE